MLHLVRYPWTLQYYHIVLFGYYLPCPKFSDITNCQYLWKRLIYAVRMQENADQNNSEYRHFLRSATVSENWSIKRNSTIRRLLYRRVSFLVILNISSKKLWGRANFRLLHENKLSNKTFIPGYSQTLSCSNFFPILVIILFKALNLKKNEPFEKLRSINRSHISSRRIWFQLSSSVFIPDLLSLLDLVLYYSVLYFDE